MQGVLSVLFVLGVAACAEPPKVDPSNTNFLCQEETQGGACVADLTQLKVTEDDGCFKFVFAGQAHSICPEDNADSVNITSCECVPGCIQITHNRGKIMSVCDTPRN